MRYCFAVLAAVVAAFVAPVAGAQTFNDRYLTATGTLGLKNGDGWASVTARGDIIGNVDRGRVRIRNLPDGSGTEINVSGEEWKRVIDSRTTVYGGTDLRFRAFGGAWRVRLRGVGIDASAAGRGLVALRGTDGSFAVDSDDYDDWPDEATRFRFGD